MEPSGGPLQGVRVIEVAGLGPAPFAAMMLSDLGAEVIRIDRPNAESSRTEVINRGRRSLAVDLKAPGAAALVLRLLDRADILIEGFRPGVMERLGLGPEVCLARNPRLVYGRMTGWGQDGPLASAAGHDINYLALSGLLWPIGHSDRPPPPPLNLVADFGGGGMLLVVGVLAALTAARGTDRGQVVDAAMVDGAAALGAMLYGMLAGGQWQVARGANMLDGGAPFYGVYETADGRWISIAALEPQFYRLMLTRLGLDDGRFDDQWDRARWPALRAALDALFRSRSRDAWCSLLEGTDVCFAPVLDPLEAPHHPHNRARGTYLARDGVVQPRPAPRFSGTPAALSLPPPHAGEHGAAVLADWGFAADEIAAASAAGIVRA